jgi:hypothetical protein
VTARSKAMSLIRTIAFGLFKRDDRVCTEDDKRRPARLRWRLGVLAGLALALLSLYPQFALWRATGARSPYVPLWFDEGLYSAYVNTLVEGRPRRNAPYTGRMDSPGSPQPETFLSVQFVPPYMLAWPARLFGLSASTVFTLLAPLSAFASALALFWLLGSVTKDDRVACAGTLLLLCVGSLAGTPDALRLLLRLHQPFELVQPFHFLRRYQPAVPFPFFLAFCALVYTALVCESGRAAARRAVLAGLTFAVLVFSYYFLWTAALAWLACVFVLWLVFRRDEVRRALTVFGIIAALAVAALVPYVLLLSRRAPETDSVQELALTHAPDLFRLPELLGALVLAALVAAALKGFVSRRDGAWLFAAACALAPFVCFNQQVLTGRSLQPNHYQFFITPCLVVAAGVVTTALLWRGLKGVGARVPRASLVIAALVSLCWAGAATAVQSRKALPNAVLRAGAQPLASRLRELARGAPADQVASQVVLFTPSLMWVEAETMPTDAPQSVLFAPHIFYVTGDWSESKERLYQHFYYGGFDRDKMEAFARAEERNLRFAFLTLNPSPPPADTFRQWLIADYLAYTSSFDRERAARYQLAYLVTSADDDVDLTNLDRWYERDAGERLGNLILYRLTLRQP